MFYSVPSRLVGHTLRAVWNQQFNRAPVASGYRRSHRRASRGKVVASANNCSPAEPPTSSSRAWPVSQWAHQGPALRTSQVNLKAAGGQQRLGADAVAKDDGTPAALT